MTNATLMRVALAYAKTKANLIEVQCSSQNAR